MSQAQVRNATVVAVGLPSAGQLSDGRTVSNYAQLSAAVLTAEGWLPLIDVLPAFDPATQQVAAGGYTIAADKVTALYVVSPLPADVIAKLTDLTARVAALEAILIPLIPTPAVGTPPPTIAALGAKQAGAIYVGQQITWSDGNTWACIVGPLNSTATPATWPQGWAQKTGLPAVIPAWSGASVAYKIGDLVTYTGATYRCIQAHTSQAGWNPPAVPALWIKQ